MSETGINWLELGILTYKFSKVISPLRVLSICVKISNINIISRRKRQGKKILCEEN